jgi:hypothetical protein
MGLETKALHQIEKAFNEVGASKPSMYWQYGTLWIETEDKNELELVKQAMIEDVLDPKFTVQFSEMKPTEREPWTEWAMDIIENKEVVNVLA